ncbi:MAG: hypothetical protein KC549_19430, partial [Myxococcales bacterium]|nr:hypothetical protein [Myxococcales bacterium]
MRRNIWMLLMLSAVGCGQGGDGAVADAALADAAMGDAAVVDAVAVDAAVVDAGAADAAPPLDDVELQAEDFDCMLDWPAV